MRSLVIFLFTLLLSSTVFAQELNCTVNVNYDKITNVSPQIFKTLQKSLSDFVNKTVWTEQSYKQDEKINCSMFITINSFESNQISASIQVQSSRPIYNSSYSSPIININDKDFNFSYVEYENLTFNPNSYDSNLTAVIAFYTYIIIGADYDSFSLDGGTPYYQIAQNIVNLASASGVAGWSQSEKNQNRYYLITDLLSPTFEPYRTVLYQYHFKGLDVMADEVKKSKEIIKKAINSLMDIQSTRPNAYLTRTFFDAKADEIVSLFSGGPSIAITDLVDNLNRLSPTNSIKWSQIKF